MDRHQREWKEKERLINKGTFVLKTKVYFQFEKKEY